MTNSSRREMLGAVAQAALLGAMTAEGAQHVHEAVGEERKAKGKYKLKALRAGEFESLTVLCEAIMPGAAEGGAAEFIDTLAGANKALTAIFAAGLAWLDEEAQKRYQKGFAACMGGEQTELMDTISAGRKATGASAGTRLFETARRMTIDAYFTSKAGRAALGVKA